MATQADVRRLALALPESVEAPHFEATSFRTNGKIFCTMRESADWIVLKFTPEDQYNLTQDDPDRIRPVAGRWGTSGWTEAKFPEIAEARLTSLLALAWATVAPKRLRT